MAKKNIEVNQAPAKSIDEMTDVEFITSADYLASPYYRAYISAKSRVDNNNYEGFQPMTSAFEQNRQINRSNSNAKAVPDKAFKGAGYIKKRGFTLFLTAFFMLIIIAAAVVGLLEISGVSTYASVYIEPITTDTVRSIDLLDPVIGLIKKVFTINQSSLYFDKYMTGITANTDLLTKISMYAVPVAALLIVVFALISFFKAVCAMFAKRYPNGLYKKYKFGFLSIVMLLCGAIMLVGGLFASGLEIKVILDFILQKSTVLYAGYGLYALIVIPLITLVLSCINYKKVK